MTLSLAYKKLNKCALFYKAGELTEEEFRKCFSFCLEGIILEKTNGYLNRAIKRYEKRFAI